MDPRVYVYISGRYHEGDLFQNVREALEAAAKVTEAGAFPFIPQLAFSWHILYSPAHLTRIAQDLAWLEQCDILYRLPGYSEGADREIQWAVKFGIPVVHNNYGALLSAIERARERKTQEVGP